MNIRIAERTDREKIRAIYRRTFSKHENEIVAQLAVDLLTEQSKPPAIAWIAEEGALTIGHISFSPVWLAKETAAFGYLLAPLAIHPDHQKKGVGTSLVKRGVHYLQTKNISMIFVYGDPAYYGRFGFKAELAQHFTAPYPLAHPFGWQAIPLDKHGDRVEKGALRCVPPLDNPELW